MKGSDGVSKVEEEGSILEKGITSETAESFSETRGDNTSSGIEEEQDSASEKRKEALKFWRLVSKVRKVVR